MKVKELIEKMGEYNPDAEINVIARNRAWNFTFSFGGSEGVKKESCETVSFYVDALNESETIG